MCATDYGMECKYFVCEELRTCVELPGEYPEGDCCSICLIEF